MQQVTFTNSVTDRLQAVIDSLDPDGVFLLTDTNTAPIAERELSGIAFRGIITIGTGEDAKSLESLCRVWDALIDGEATRRSLLVNFGGGLLTDLGGFAAASFKRGIRFVNVPTTVLGAVDAAVGGKTGINFRGLKNEIGTFREADEVIVSTRFFSSLPDDELLSGFGEMIKHSLLAGERELDEIIEFDICDADPDALLPLLQHSVRLKRDIVAQDPTERGLRKALNLGHTFGHAFEERMFQRHAPIPHGHAVAFGLIPALVLSHLTVGFPAATLHKVAGRIKELYGASPVGCSDFDAVMALMRHDKKNASASAVNFTLLSAPGRILTDHTPNSADIEAAFDIACDIMH